MTLLKGCVEGFLTIRSSKKVYNALVNVGPDWSVAQLTKHLNLSIHKIKYSLLKVLQAFHDSEMNSIYGSKSLSECFEF